MSNTRTNGFDDLDILDLDDLLSEGEPEEETAASEPAAQPSQKVSAEAPKEAAEKPQSARPQTEVRNKPQTQPAEQAQYKKLPRQKAPAKIQKTAEEEPQQSAEENLPDGIEFVALTDTPTSPKSSVPPKSAKAGASKAAPAEAPSEAGKPPVRRPSPAKAAPQKKAKAPADADMNRVPEDMAPERPSRRPPLHLILPVLIVAVLAIAVVRFAVWSRGSDLHIDSSGSADRFNIEVNDNMVYLPDSKLEGHKDDGVTTILCLGNEPFSEDTSDSGLAGQIAALGNCNVINASFPDSQVTCENATYKTDNLDSMDDIFNLFYVSYAISIGDFSSLKTVASAHTENPAYLQSVQALEDTDFDKVDMIVIMYDGIDYINGMAMQNPDVPDELTTYVGSLRNSFQLLQEKYPYIRIVFLSPYYAEYDGASSRTTDLGNGTIVNYFQWAYDTCGDCSVSFLDNYYGSVNETNYKDFLSDGIHLNAEGRTKIADHFVYKVIQDNYAEYNAQTLSVAN